MGIKEDEVGIVFWVRIMWEKPSIDLSIDYRSKFGWRNVREGRNNCCLPINKKVGLSKSGKDHNLYHFTTEFSLDDCEFALDQKYINT